MKARSYNGFTIVELLIVIVVIAILAGITVVAFNGVSKRAEYSKMQQDLSSIVKALELYKADNGKYPNSEACDNQTGNYANGWCGWNQGTGNSFIPGLSPNYMNKIPALNESLANNDTYLFKSSSVITGANDGGGKYYALIRFNPAGLSQAELQNNTKLWGSAYTGIAWGYKSDSGMSEADW